MSAKLYEDIAYRGGIQAITFSFKNFMTLWNFNIRVDGKT